MYSNDSIQLSEKCPKRFLLVGGFDILNIKRPSCIEFIFIFTFAMSPENIICFVMPVCWNNGIFLFIITIVWLQVP